MPQSDLYGSYRYLIEVDGGIRAGFEEVSGYDPSADVIEYRNGSEVRPTRKLPGVAKYTNITLKNGLTADLGLYHWLEDAFSGRITRKSLIIIAFDNARQECARWIIHNTWPTRIEAPDFKAAASEIPIQSLELAHEGIQRV